MVWCSIVRSLSTVARHLAAVSRPPSVRGDDEALMGGRFGELHRHLTLRVSAFPPLSESSARAGACPRPHPAQGRRRAGRVGVDGYERSIAWHLLTISDFPVQEVCLIPEHAMANSIRGGVTIDPVTVEAESISACRSFFKGDEDLGPVGTDAMDGRGPTTVVQHSESHSGAP